MTEPPVHTHGLRFRRRTAARWADTNPIPGPGEPCLERDTGKFKIGDGQTRWLDLPYFVPHNEFVEGGETLAEHIVSPLPHPVYDDAPSLALLYENAKV
ncbi:MAG TPA: hypothetical protein PKD12_08255 [Nitrospira sp.]|nr:hypothetical protein [Nitrospira sp.]